MKFINVNSGSVGGHFLNTPTWMCRCQFSVSVSQLALMTSPAVGKRHSRAHVSNKHSLQQILFITSKSVSLYTVPLHKKLNLDHFHFFAACCKKWWTFPLSTSSVKKGTLLVHHHLFDTAPSHYHKLGLFGVQNLLFVGR